MIGFPCIFRQSHLGQAPFGRGHPSRVVGLTMEKSWSIKKCRCTCSHSQNPGEATWDSYEEEIRSQNTFTDLRRRSTHIVNSPMNIVIAPYRYTRYLQSADSQRLKNQQLPQYRTTWWSMDKPGIHVDEFKRTISMQRCRVFLACFQEFQRL